VQSSLANVLRPVVVGVVFVSALLANELAASLPIGFGCMAADGTFTGRVVSGHELDCHARQLGLVGQFSLQVVERPRMQVSPMLSTSLHPRTNTPEVFKGYPSLRAFGIRDYYFRNTMIGIRREAGLFATAFLQEPLGGLGSFVLESAANAEVTATKTPDLPPAEEFSVTGSGQNNQSEINADVIRDGWDNGFGNGDSNEEIELAIPQNKIGFPSWQSEQFPLTFAADERNLLPAVDCPDGNGILFAFPGQNAGIIGDTSRWSEFPLNVMVNLIGVGHLGDTADNHLRREEREVMPGGMVYGFMQIVLAEHLGIESNRGETIADAVCLFDGLSQGNRLFLIGSQLNLTYQLHGSRLLSRLEQVNNKRREERDSSAAVKTARFPRA
jgi:hypothetical protein